MYPSKVEDAIRLVRAQAEFGGHSLEVLEVGAIPFAGIEQVQYVAGLLRQCGCPEEWRLLVTGIFAERELRSTKDLGMAEAGALIDYLVAGSDGRGEGPGPCEEAQEVMGLLLVGIMAAGVAQIKRREEGGKHVEVIQQLGFC